MKTDRMRLRISPSVAILLVMMAVADRSGTVALTLFAALLHECGHLTAARLLGIPPKSLRIDFLGARIDVSGCMLSYGAEWLLCAAGPLASLLLAACASVFWGICPPAVTFSCASLVLGILNLLPIRSFDGGRMLECALSHFTTPRICSRVMSLTSFLFLFLLWATAVYFLLRAADGLSLLCFSMSLFLRFFEGEGDVFLGKTF